MASIDTQDISLTKHHTLYDAVDPTSALKNSASGKVIFITSYTSPCQNRGFRSATIYMDNAKSYKFLKYPTGPLDTEIVYIIFLS
jgi:hypothetical protein